MLQVMLKRGKIVPVNLPAPVVEPGTVLIKTVRSCVSAGTELAEVAKAGRNVIRQALDQPGAAWKLVNKLKTEGLAAVSERITGKREIGSALGYSASGIVIQAAEDELSFRAGDRVAVAGVGIANHAEYIQAPFSMVKRIPDSVSFDAASTVALGAIALHAARRASLGVGEIAVVYGAGAIGQLVVQILAGSGVRVIAADIDPARVSIALRSGAEAGVDPSAADLASRVMGVTGGYGADAVLYCASGLDASAMSSCASVARRKGKLVLVGTWEGGVARQDLYAKELDVLVSTSYGPGRYDERYESRGVDYPYAYVRWTEGRNMEEYLRLLGRGRIGVDGLIDSVHPVRSAADAFRRLQEKPRPLFVLLDYGEDLPSALSSLETGARRVAAGPSRKRAAGRRIRVALIGAGRFATGMHLPNLKALDGTFELRTVCCRTGGSAMLAARKFDAAFATTEYQDVLADPEIDLVMICTHPSLHAEMAMAGLRAGKAVFVEKPLCLTMGELEELDACVASLGSGVPVMCIGFNRRFSPYAQEMREAVGDRINPLFLRYRMNAGNAAGPSDEAGRIIGEACHAIDFASFLSGSPVRSYSSAHLRPSTAFLQAGDTASISLEYEDGSVAGIDYFAGGSPELPKENVEVHFDGTSIVLDNFQGLRGYGVTVRCPASDQPRKGHREELAVLADHIRGKRPGWPIPWESVRETTEITLEISGRGAAQKRAAQESAERTG